MGGKYWTVTLPVEIIAGVETNDNGDTEIYPPGMTPRCTDLPVISYTSLSGGSVLSCSTGSWDNEPTSYEYQWIRDDEDILGGTDSTYTLVGADMGTDISCRVTAINSSGSRSLELDSVSTLTDGFVDDDFTGVDGDAPKSALWYPTKFNITGTYPSEDNVGSFEIQGNAVEFEISNGITFAVLCSKFMLSGDFDVQVDFLIDAIPSSRWAVALYLSDDPNSIPVIDGTVGYYMSRYYGSSGPYLTAAQGKMTYSLGSNQDLSGGFRITRSGSEVKTYYRPSTVWYDGLTQSNGGTADVYIKLYIRTFYSDQSLIAGFDNFIVNSGTIVWP